MSIDFRTLPDDYKLFTYIDSKGEAIHIDIPKLLRDKEYRRSEVVAFVIHQRIIDQILKSNAVNLDKVKSIMCGPGRIPPITVLEDELDNPPTHMLGDGNHRLIAFALAAIPQIPARLVQRKLWGKYIVTGVPQITQDELIALPPRR